MFADSRQTVKQGRADEQWQPDMQEHFPNIALHFDPQGSFMSLYAFHRDAWIQHVCSTFFDDAQFKVLLQDTHQLHFRVAQSCLTNQPSIGPRKVSKSTAVAVCSLKKSEDWTKCRGRFWTTNPEFRPKFPNVYDVFSDGGSFAVMIHQWEQQGGEGGDVRRCDEYQSVLKKSKAKTHVGRSKFP